MNGAPPFMDTWSSAAIRVSSCRLPVRPADKRARAAHRLPEADISAAAKPWAMGAKATFSGAGVWSAEHTFLHARWYAL